GVGMGPWEVSLERAFGANSGEARRIVFNRGAAQNRGGQVQKAFASNLPANQQLPAYASMAWGGFNNTNPAVPALQFPVPTNMYIGQPNYTNGYDSTR